MTKFDETTSSDSRIQTEQTENSPLLFGYSALTVPERSDTPFSLNASIWK